MDKRRRNERALKQAVLRDTKFHGIAAGTLFLFSFLFGVGVDIRFSAEDGAAFITDFFAPYISLHEASLIAFMLACAALTPFHRLRHFTATLKNLVAGTILIAVALTTGSLGGMVAVELFNTATGLGPVAPHELFRSSLLIAVAWFHAVFIVTLVLGIGNAGILFHQSEAGAHDFLQ